MRQKQQYHESFTEFSLWKRELSEILDEIEGEGLRTRNSADYLKFLIEARLLSLDDMQQSPQKFFLAHRMLAQKVPRLGAGTWMRFALHYNLFCGAVLALGTPLQIQQFLLRNEVRPSLGCLMLTEQGGGGGGGGGGGTSSNFETTAELSHDGTYFVLNTPSDNAVKTWISQGLVANEAVIIATMIVHNYSYGPQAFLVPLRNDHGELRRGVTMIDMGPTEAGSDVDNARITFSAVRIPHSTHLCRYLQVQDGTVRHPKGRNVHVMEILDQSLYAGRLTGRLIVAQAALAYTRVRLQHASDESANNKVCWTPLNLTVTTTNSRRSNKISPGGSVGSGGAGPHQLPLKLSKGRLAHAFKTLDRLDRFTAQIQAQLCHCLKHGIHPNEALQQAIAVAKVEAVETSIDLYNSLLLPPQFKRDRVAEFLKCCKMSEGDTRDIMQKLARDVARARGHGPNSTTNASSLTEVEVQTAMDCLQHEINRLQTVSQDTLQPKQVWEMCDELVLRVAEAQMEHVLDRYGCLPQE